MHDAAPMSHEDVQEALGAYALDAVEPAERGEIERHLAVCPRCRAEVAEHREVAAVLGYAGSDAPPGLWDRIAATLEEPPPALRLTRVGPGDTVDGRGGGPPAPGSEAGATGSRPGADGLGAAPVPAPVPIASARRSVSRRAFVTLAAAAAVVAAVLGVEVARLNGRTDRLGGSVGTEAMAAAYRSARSQPGARLVSLRSPDGASAAAVVILPDGTAYLGPDNLPALPKDQTYQLWGVVGADKVSLAVLGAAPRVTEFGAPSNVTALAVTAESAGGVVVSQHQPVVVGAVPPVA